MPSISCRFLPRATPAKSSIFAALILCALFAPAAHPAESAPPVVLYASTSSPKHLVRAIDTVLTSALRGTPEEKAYQPGSAPAIAAELDMPWLFDAEGVSLGLALDVESNGKYSFAVLLDGVDPARLVEELPKAGIPVDVAGDAGTFRADFITPGLVVHLVGAAGNKSVALGENAGTIRSIRDRLGGWRPHHPPEADILVTANVKRLRELFPDSVRELRGELADEKRTRANIGRFHLPATMPPAAKDAVADACLRVMQRAAEFALEVDSARLKVGVEGETVAFALAMTPAPTGRWAKWIAEWAKRDGVGTGLEKAVSSDASALFVDRLPENGIFPGGLFTYAATALMENFLPDGKNEIATLRKEFAANPARERVSAFYLSDNGLTRAQFSRIPDGRKQVELWIRNAGLCDRLLQNLGDSEKSPYFTVESGKTGKARYRLLKPQFDAALPLDEEKARILEQVNSYRLYLASNRNTMVALSGFDLSPNDLLAQIDRIEAANPDALVDEPAVRKILGALGPSQLGYGMFKPGDLTVKLAELAAAGNGGAVREFQNSGGWFGYAMGIRDGGLTLTQTFTLAALNDLIVNSVKLQEQGSGSAGQGSRGGDDMTDWDDDDQDDWDWDEDDDDDGGGWGGDEQKPPAGGATGRTTLDFLNRITGGAPSGQVPPENPRVAELKRLALAGDGESQYQLGLVYANGSDGQERNYHEAAKWYEMAAAQELTGAMSALAVIYLDHLDRREEGLRILRKASDLTGKSAPRILGIYYRDGESGVPKDIREAVRWFRVGAERGDELSCFFLGLIYGNGTYGLDQDLAQGMEWYRKGAALGHAASIRNMGLLYEADGPDWKTDFAKATGLYIKAAEAGDALASYWAGLNYFHGQPGLPRDLSKAKRWLTLAAQSGQEKAKELLEQIPPDVVAETQVVHRLKAADLIREFAANPAAAEAKYKGQALELVMGEVRSRMNMSGARADITLTLEGSPYTITCFVLGKGGSISVRTGESHLFRGVCAGLSGQTIEMGECENLPVETNM